MILDQESLNLKHADEDTYIKLHHVTFITHFVLVHEHHVYVYISIYIHNYNI